MADIAVARLLRRGARVMAESQRLCERSRRLHDRVRVVIATYRLHRWRVIRGGSEDDNEERLAILRGFAAYPAVKTFVGPSRGRACAVCGALIRPNETEYDIEAGSANATVDADCYRLFIDAIAATPRSSAM
jgi:hypothetical protein